MEQPLYEILGTLRIKSKKYMLGDPAYNAYDNDHTEEILKFKEMKTGTWIVFKVKNDATDEYIYILSHNHVGNKINMDDLNNITTLIPLCSGNIGLYELDEDLVHVGSGTSKEYELFKHDFTLYNPLGDLPVEVTISTYNNDIVSICFYI